MMYGVEINLVDDGVPIAYNPEHRLLEDATWRRIRRRDNWTFSRL